MSIGDAVDSQLGSRITQGILFLILASLNISIIGLDLMLSVAYVGAVIIMGVAWLLGVSFGRRQVYKKVDRARQSRE